jgi:hypothetical protein
MRYSMTWKVCFGVLVISVLAWLPHGATTAPLWWGPAPCWGQEKHALNPEAIVVGSFSSNNVTGCSITKDNRLTGTNGTYHASIDNSFVGFKGISQVNQAVGSLNNQMNVTSVCGSGGQLSQIGQSVKSEIKDNYLNTSGNCYKASITGGSYKGGAGIAQVNQAAGNMNSQYNGFSMNIGTARPKGAISLTDVELCAARTDNTKISDPCTNTYKTQNTTDPANNFHGVFSSSQVAGDLNSVKTLFTVNVITAK